MTFVLNVKAVAAAFNQEKALVGAFSVITNLRMELFQAPSSGPTFQGCSSDNRKVCVGPSVFVNLRPAALASYHDNHETAHRPHRPTLLLLSPAAKTPPQIFLMNKELFSVDTSRQTQLFPAAHVGDGEISSSSSRSTSSLHTPKQYGTS